MIRSTRWALSKKDLCVHLIPPASERPADAVSARCGHEMPADAHDYDQPPPGPPCERCRLIFLTDFAAKPSPSQGRVI
jgi:hypothetical protein